MDVQPPGIASMRDKYLTWDIEHCENDDPVKITLSIVYHNALSALLCLLAVFGVCSARTYDGFSMNRNVSNMTATKLFLS